jgi:hypothetical protein
VSLAPHQSTLQEISLGDVPMFSRDILAGRLRGRVVVDVNR